MKCSGLIASVSLNDFTGASERKINILSESFKINFFFFTKKDKLSTEIFTKDVLKNLPNLVFYPAFSFKLMLSWDQACFAFKYAAIIACLLVNILHFLATKTFY